MPPPPAEPAPPEAYRSSVAAASVMGLAGANIPPPPPGSAVTEEERQSLRAAEQQEQPPMPPGYKAPPAHLCLPPSTPEEVQRRAELERKRQEAEALLAAKEESVRAHYAAITDVVYQRLSDERRAEIDKIEDAEARISAISDHRAEFLTQGEAEADNLEEFRTQVRAHDEAISRSAELLDEARANAEVALRL